MVFATTALSLAGMAAAPVFAWLVAAAAVAGLGQALGNPVTNRLIVGAVVSERQGVVTGIKQSGVQVGAFFMGVALPLGVATVGWRRSLVFTVVGLSAVLPLTLAGTSPRRSTEARRPEPEDGAHESGRLGIREVAPWLTAYAFFIGGGASAAFTYLPLYANERLGFSTELAATVVGFVGFVGALARLAWGYAADRGEGGSATLAGLGAGAAVSALALMAAEPLGAWSLWIGALLFGATATAWNVIGMATIVKGVAITDTGNASGLVMLGFFAGYIGSPLAFGALVDGLGSYTPAWLLVLAQFACALAIASMWHRTLARKRRERPDWPVAVSRR
jgi:predicted MFS family arabinose efflux permease